MGLGGIGLGILLGLLSLILGINGWEVSRIWLYLLGSAMMFLVGIQLFIYWILLRVLDELSQREFLTKLDMNNTGI
jgi:hypothetical protein